MNVSAIIRTGVVIALALVVLVGGPPRAEACTCAPPPSTDDQMAAADWVFVGRQIDRTESDGLVTITMEVLEVYEGDLPEVVELLTGLGSAACGVDFSAAGQVGLALQVEDDGEAWVTICGGVIDIGDLRARYEPLPEPTSDEPAAFLVGVTNPRARVAALDRFGHLVGHGDGQGLVTAAAACPDGERVVEIVEPALGPSIGGDRPPQLAIRNLTTLAVEDEWPIELSERDVSQLNGFGWVFDLECHDPDADVITYLPLEGIYDSFRGANMPGPAMLHLWRGGELTQIDVGTARTVAVDVAASTIYAITGDDGRTLETRSFAGEILGSESLPGLHVGWQMALSSDGGRLAILARTSPLDEINWYYAEVDAVLVVDLQARRSERSGLGVRSFAHVVEWQGDDVVVAVIDTESTFSLDAFRIRNGEVHWLGSVPSASFWTRAAIGEESILASGEATADGPPMLAMNIETGEATPVDVLGRVISVTALPGQDEDAAATSTTTTTAERSAEPGSDAPVADITVPPQVRSILDDHRADIAADGNMLRVQRSVWPWITGGLSGLAVAVLTWLRRRRRTATPPSDRP